MYNKIWQISSFSKFRVTFLNFSGLCAFVPLCLCAFSKYFKYFWLSSIIFSGVIAVNSFADALPQAISPYLAVPRFDTDTTKGVYLINLDTGGMYYIDRLDEDADKIRVRPIKKINILTALGRTEGEAVQPGEILAKELKKGKGGVDTMLVVDTTTGAMIFVTDLGYDPDKGEIRKVSGKPAQVIASSDRNYVLFMRYDTKKGDAIGAYLCHLTDQQCLYFDEIQEKHKEYSPDITDKICLIPDAASIVEIHAGVPGTRFHLLADNTTGDVFWIEADQKNPKKLFCRKERVNFLEVFKLPKDTPIIHSRFMMIPLLIDNDSVWHVLLIDAGTGKFAMFNVHDYKWLELKRPDENIYKRLPGDIGRDRYITAVPVILKGFTKGALLFDNATGRIVRLDMIDDLRKK